jgi:hypothetical protein
MALGAVCSLFASNAGAFIIPLPMIPVMPTLDPGNDAIHFLQLNEAKGVVTNVKNISNTLTGVLDVKGLGLTYNDNLDLFKSTGPFAGGGSGGGNDSKKTVEATKDIQEASVADIYDFDSVRNATYKMFFVLPTDGLNDEHCYRELARKFFTDTSLEIYSTAKVLSANIEVLEKRIDDLEEALNDGGGDEGENLDEVDNTNTAWENAYQTYDILDQLLRMTQELKAMRMQYEAALAIQSKVPPIRKKEIEMLKSQGNEDKTSFIFNKGKTYASKSELAFAQIAGNETVLDDNEDYNFLGYKDAPKPLVENPFAGQEESLKALGEVTELGREVYDAHGIHSLISDLPSYRETFVTYERFKRMHEHVLNMLRISDQCAIGYLGSYYNNPEKVWSGGHLGTLANQHELRTGVSKWLIDKFDVAKAVMVTPMEPEELQTPVVDSSVDNKNTMSASTMKNGKKPADEEIMNPVKERKSEQIGRDNYQLAWNIGATGSRSLGDDQQGINNWGSIDKPFKMWNDQKNFYDQYVNAKYDNIIKYLEQIDLRPGELDIARQLNKDNKDKIVANFEGSAKSVFTDWNSDLARFQEQTPVTEVALEESKWIESVQQKVSAMQPNYKELDAREVKLKKQREALVKKMTDLLKQAQLPNVIKQIMEVEAEIKKVDDEIKDIAENRLWLNGYAYDLTGVLYTEAWTVETKNELLSAQNTEAEEVQKVRKEYSDAVNAYGDKIAAIYEQRSAEFRGYENQLNDLSDKIDAAQEKVNLYNKNINKAEEAKIEVKEKMTNTLSTTVNKADMEKKAKAQKAIAVSLGKEAKKIIAKLDERSKYYDGKLAEAEREHALKAKEIMEKEPGYDDMAPLAYLYDNKVAKKVSDATKAYTPALGGYLNVAAAISTEFRPYTVELAEKTKADILNIGDSLYYQTSNANVNSKHVALIENLKNIDLEDVLSFSSVLKNTYGSPLALMEAIKNLYNKYMISQICPEDACYAADEEYYVALSAKDRDFQAPKGPINEYLPPVREVFFFDEVDYEGVYSKDKNTKIQVGTKTEIGVGNLPINVPVYLTMYYVSKSGLLDYGGQLPEVWQRALSGKAFVERDIDLKKFFGEDENGDNIANFYRGGRYPCNINNLGIDIDKNANFIVKASSNNALPSCQEIEVTNGVGYYRIKSKGSDETANAGAGVSAGTSSVSELGQLFTLGNDFVVFRDDVKKTFDRLIEIRKYQEEDKKYNSSIKDDIYDNAALKKNQFGDFLDYVELERTYRQAMEKVKISVDEVKELLFEELRKAGYEPSPDLNLAKEEDYNTVKNSLKNRKARVMSEVAPKLQALKRNNTPIVKERLENFELVHKALEMDSDVLIALPSSNVNLSDVSESIKTEKANLKAKEAYDKEAEKAFEDEMKKISAPYCASY